MRRFELLLAFVAVFAVLWPVVFGIRPRRGIVAAGASIALFAQLQYEGYRWQMIPLYLLGLGLAVGDVLFIDREIGWTNRVARGLFGLAGVVLAAILPLILPVPALPIPSGSEQIGTFSVALVAPDRAEIYGDTPGGPRRIMAQVWYPADVFEAQLGAWSEDWDVVAPAASRRLGFPSWFLDHTRYTSSHSADDAAPSGGSHPLIIYSHGWGEFRTVAVNQMEMLASNGYVVIAVDHTFGAVATRFPNGDVVYLDPEALPEPTLVDQETYLGSGGQLIATFAGDISQVLDAVEQGDAGPLAGISHLIDLEHVGVYGHGAGGAAAIAACLDDERCDAVVGLDPWVEPLPNKVLKDAVVQPALYMRSDESRGTTNDAVLRGIAARSQEITYWIGVDGADQSDFVVTPLLSPIAHQLGLRGSIGAGRVLQILDNYLLGFFDVYLRGTGSAALDSVSYPEVSVEVLGG